MKRPSTMKRLGSAAIEAVITASTIVPIVFLFYKLTIEVSNYVYELMASLMGWPFL